jgi:AcrR family transcriptional regulator
MSSSVAARRSRSRDTRRVSRRGGVGPVGREGSAGVSEVQRARMLSAAARVVSEYGYQKMSVARVAGGARVSRRTFYDVFEDREDCFMAIFEDALARAGERVLGAYERTESAGRADGDGGWCERVRGALEELLVFFDGEPRAASLLVVDALGAGPRVLARRAEVLKGLGARLHEDGSRAGRAVGEVAPLTGEGVIGAVFGVLHTRLSQNDPAGTLNLLNPLMGMIVLPYQGRAAARRELERPAPKGGRSPKKPGAGQGGPGVVESDPLEGLPMRITYRTLRVLGAIAEHPGASNRTVGEAADTYDQGQISKLLARLEKLGLIENTSGNDHRPTGEPNAWQLTAKGEGIERALRVRPGGDGEPRDNDKHEGSQL